MISPPGTPHSCAGVPSCAGIILDAAALDATFAQYRPRAVIHFAARARHGWHLIGREVDGADQVRRVYDELALRFE
jgi:hypothetical protein